MSFATWKGYGDKASPSAGKVEIEEEQRPAENSLKAGLYQ